MHQLLGAVDDRARLRGQFLDAGQAAARDRLVGRDHQAHQLGFVVQHLEHRHRHHGGAVRVGDDALFEGPARRDVSREVHLGHHQRHVGVLAPRRRVVDHRHPGGGEPRRLHQRHRLAGGEQRDVQTARVGGRGVFDLDLLAAERQLAALRAGRREEPHRLSAGKSRSSSSVRITWPT